MLTLTEESKYRSAVLKQLQQKVAVMAARHEELHKSWKALVCVVVTLRAERNQLREQLDRLIAEKEVSDGEDV